MMYSDSLVFLHLQKTGGNHVVRLLNRFMSLEKAGKHNGLIAEYRRPMVLLGIRNPWDWYVSLWAYGCQEEGSFYDYLVSSKPKNAARAFERFAKQRTDWPILAHHLRNIPRKDAALWRDLYKDSNDAGRFREWLHAIHELPHRAAVGDEFSSLPIAAQCGVMTARYLRVCSLVETWEQQRMQLRTTSDAEKYLAQHSTATHFVRTEALEEDVFAALTELGHEVESAQSLKEKKVNSSRRNTAQYYYDDTAERLVAQRDSVIVQAHDYTFDVLAG